MDEVKPPPENTEHTSAEEEVLLDATRMDIDISSKIKDEPTSGEGIGTDLRIQTNLSVSKPRFAFLSHLIRYLLSE